MNKKEAIEIPIIYGRSKQGEEWVEYVCSNRKEALEKVEYLKTRNIVIPEFEDEIWKKLGLGLQEREFIIDKLCEFKEHHQLEKPTYYIQYDYLIDENIEEIKTAETELLLEVISVSEKNNNNEYIHTLSTPTKNGTLREYSEKLYKISLSEIVSVGTIDKVSLNDFKVVCRPSGFSYVGKKGLNQIRKNEYWLFIRQPHE